MFVKVRLDDFDAVFHAMFGKSCQFPICVLLILIHDEVYVSYVVLGCMLYWHWLFGKMTVFPNIKIGIVLFYAKKPEYMVWLSEEFFLFLSSDVVFLQKQRNKWLKNWNYWFLKKIKQLFSLWLIWVVKFQALRTNKQCRWLKLDIRLLWITCIYFRVYFQI